MAKRQSLDGPGLPRHSNPIPAAVKIGNMVFSSPIGGQDPDTGTSHTEPEKQVEQAFLNMRRIIEAAGGTTDDIARVTVYLKDLQYRELVNKEWLKMFPDEHNRPARHSIKADLPGTAVLQLEMIAVL